MLTLHEQSASIMKNVVVAVLCSMVVSLVAGCASGRAPANPVAATEPAPPVTPPPSPATTPPPAPPAPETIPQRKDPLKEAAGVASAPFEGTGWRDLFNGTDLKGWRETQFAGRGEVECRDGSILMNMGNPFTGIQYTNEVPWMNYEVALDAMRVMGSDFFCGLTVPVGNSFCSLIVGGWGGTLVGISSLDGMDASENQTTKFVRFEQGRWYRVRLRITPDRIEGWIDNDKLIDVITTGKKIGLRPGEIEMSKPFGLACWQTSAALRQIKIRSVDSPADPLTEKQRRLL